MDLYKHLHKILKEYSHYYLYGHIKPEVIF